MPDIVLHHYPTSPYSEKVRAVLGYKNLDWHSVIIPTVMPKPDLMALTGGYRRTPVMQLGRDIYCDSKLMVRVLEQLAPDPPLIRPGRELSCLVYEQWSEKLFMLAVPLVFQPRGLRHLLGEQWQAETERFRQDRAPMFLNGSQRGPSAEASRAELPGVLARLEAQLGPTEFIDGAAPGLADFSVYHPIWFIWSNPGVAAALDPFPRIRDWVGRLSVYSRPAVDEMAADDALKRAREAPAGERGPRGAAADGPQPGDAVVVAATDYGTDPVRGTLLGLDQEEIVLRRRDERAGELRVHFPRAGFRLAADAG